MMMITMRVMMMTMLMRLLPLTVKIFFDRDEFEKRIERGDFREFERDIDDDEALDSSEPDADNVISIQNITDTIPAYAPPALSFSANTWENMVDPSHNLCYRLCLLGERG